MSMADDVAKVKRAKKFAIAQLLIGFLLFGFGIGEQVLKTFFHRFGIGIVAGILVSRIGVLSILYFCTQGCFVLCVKMINTVCFFLFLSGNCE